MLQMFHSRQVRVTGGQKRAESTSRGGLQKGLYSDPRGAREGPNISTRGAPRGCQDILSGMPREAGGVKLLNFSARNFLIPTNFIL